MDKAEALAFVSRLFDAAQAGAVLWGDALLIKRFLSSAPARAAKRPRTATARAARVHALAGSEPPASASAGDQSLRWWPGLGVPTAGTSRGRTHEASNLQSAHRCHEPLPMGIGTKPFSCDRSAAQPDAPTLRLLRHPRPQPLV